MHMYFFFHFNQLRKIITHKINMMKNSMINMTTDQQATYLTSNNQGYRQWDGSQSNQNWLQLQAMLITFCAD